MVKKFQRVDTECFDLASTERIIYYLTGFFLKHGFGKAFYYFFFGGIILGELWGVTVNGFTFSN